MATRAVAVSVTVVVTAIASTPFMVVPIFAIAAIFPWGWPIADRGVRDANQGESTEDLPGLLAAFRAGDELDNIRHRHPLFRPGAAC